MHKVIDCAWDIGAYAGELRARGVATVIRYYNIQNSNKLPSKRLDPEEAKELAEAGLSLAVVFQQGGGHDGHIDQLSPANGTRDGRRSLELADAIGQPDGSAIYFAVDHDYYKSADLAVIARYFEAARAQVHARFRVGVYGSGTVAAMLRKLGLVELVWLPGAVLWSGTKQMLETDQWALFQKALHLSYEGKFIYDGNIVGGKWTDFGQFTLADAALAVPTPAGTGSQPHSQLSEVIATSGLKLRRGPSTDYEVEDTLPEGTMVNVIGFSGDWAKVDINGDGAVDGFVFAAYLRPVSGGLPLPGPAGRTAYEIARGELGTAEVAGSGNNPRIVMYHRTTNHWSGTDDSVAWCSSFVNYCVEQSGHVGTDSQAARSWKDWGTNVTDNPREGDIVVFARGTGGSNGHVGFFVEDLGSHIKILGGNQSNSVRYQNYPKDGTLAGEKYRLLSIRRP